MLHMRFEVIKATAAGRKKVLLIDHQESQVAIEQRMPQVIISNESIGQRLSHRLVYILCTAKLGEVLVKLQLWKE